MVGEIWTEREIDVLRSRYTHEGGQLFHYINKSPNAIRIKAHRLNLSKLEHRRSVVLSKTEEQIIIGGLLGDLYCGIRGRSKNARIEGAHCKRQSEYMFWKLRLLKSLSFSFRKTKFNTLFFESKSYPCLNYYYNLFYSSGKKRVSDKILNKLNELGLAVWYMDDGSYRKWKNSSKLCTLGFTYNENLLIEKWFEERWYIFPKIYPERRRLKENRPCYYLNFSVAETKKLINIIRDYIHPSMKYKIGVFN